MLKLLVFAPCEKVIVNKDESTSTLITILESLNSPIIPGEENLLPDAVVPFRWYSYALWHIEMESDYGEYEQRIKLAYTDDREGFEMVLPFNFERPNKNHRTTVVYPGFPLMPPGVAYLKIELRKKAEGDEGWENIAQFPIVINRPEATAPPASEASAKEP